MQRKLIPLLLVLFTTVVHQASHGQDQPLTIITEDWPPYNYQINGEVGGFSTEIVRAIMKRLDTTYTIRLLPGARGEEMLENDPRVILFSLFRTPEREQRFKWIGPIAQDAVYFYKKKGSTLSINTIDDAKQVDRIACRHKGLVFSVLKKHGFTNLDLTPNPEGIIHKVVMGRTDLAIGETPLGIQYWLSKANLPADTLEQTPVKLLEFPLYLACTKDIPDEVIERWQQALEEIKASGEYEQIYNTYLRD